MWVLVVVSLAAAAAPAAAQSSGLPDVPSLRAIRAELETIVAGLERDKLPAEFVVRKVREGVAKRIDPQRILIAALAIASDARLVARIVRLRLPPRADQDTAIRVAIGARAAGLTVSGIDRLLRRARWVGPAIAITAVDTAADMVAGGYPAQRSADLVAAVLEGPKPLSELPVVLAELEATRVATGLRRALVVDSVADYVEIGNSLAAAARMSRGSAATE